MASKKHPSNPNVPLYGEMPNLDIPAELFGTDNSLGQFHSKCLSDRGKVADAEQVYKTVKVNGKGKVVFKSKEEFLTQLDNALLEFEIPRHGEMPDDSGDLNDQRAYFKNLHKAASSLNKALGDIQDNHSRRLAHVGFILPQHLTGEGLDNDFLRQARNLEHAAEKAVNDLKNKNAGRHADLYLLIEELAGMREGWPTLTTDPHNKDNRGVFFELVKAVYPMVNLSNPEYITDNTIVNGIKLVQKS
jgi:hypothetical protein